MELIWLSLAFLGGPAFDGKAALPLDASLKVARFSSDGREIAAADGMSLKVWSFPEKKILFSAKHLFTHVHDLVFLSNGELAIADEKGVWKLDWKRKTKPTKVLRADFIFRVMPCSPTMFVCVNGAGRMVVVDTITKKTQILDDVRLISEGMYIPFIDVTRAGDVFFSDDKGVVKRLDPKTLRVTTVFDRESVKLLKVLRSGKELVVMNLSTKQIRVQDMDGRPIVSHEMTGLVETSVFDVFKDDKITITDRNDVAYQFSLPELQEIRRFQVPSGGLISLSHHPSNPDLMIGGGEPHELIIWDFRKDRKAKP